LKVLWQVNVRVEKLIFKVYWS